MPPLKPKPLHYQNPRYLDFIRSQPCDVCGDTRVDAHHLSSRGSGGKPWSGSDYSALPFCRAHHQSYHSLGEGQFEIVYRVNLWKDVWMLMHRYFVEKEDESDCEKPKKTKK
jgi:hypothetical protein